MAGLAETETLGLLLAEGEFEDIERELERARSLAIANIADEKIPPAAGSWQAVDLGPVLDSDNRKPPPAMLPRSDGANLIYDGKIHMFYGEPESAKGWLALSAAAQRLEAGEHVLHVDFEDEADEAVERLLSLGVPAQAIREAFHYIRPDEPFGDAARASIEALLDEFMPRWVILDGFTDALTNEGIDLRDNTGIAKWMSGLPELIRRRGIACVLIDHVTKDRESRGGYSIGGQHKKAKVDVAYELIVADPLGIGMTGRVKVLVQKDRGGCVRPLTHPGSKLVAHMVAESDSEGRVTINLEAPSRDESTSAWRPTGLMVKVSRAIEDEPGINLRELRARIPGRSQYVDQARQHLISEGFIEERQDGPAKRHYLIQPYREPASELVPDHGGMALD